MSESYTKMCVSGLKSTSAGPLISVPLKWFIPQLKNMLLITYIKIRAQHSDDDLGALVASVPLASDHVRLFSPDEEGVTRIVVPRKSTNWDAEMRE